MRIIAGKYGGRRLSVPKGRDIRPTSDKVRGAIFNALEARGVLEEAQVLDAFCGSGALGLEALSRGAAHCTFIDKERSSLELAKENVAAVEALENAAFILKDATQIEPLVDQMQKYSLVFLDPPYHKGLVDKVLQGLSGNQCLEDGAYFVVETEKECEPNPGHSFLVQNSKIYGDTRITFLMYQA